MSTPVPLPAYSSPVVPDDSHTLRSTADVSAVAERHGVHLRIRLTPADPARTVPVPERATIVRALAGVPSVALVEQLPDDRAASYLVSLSASEPTVARTFIRLLREIRSPAPD